MTPLGLLAFAASFSVVRTADLVLRPPQSVTSAINGTAAFNCSIANGTLQWDVKLNAAGVSLYWPYHEVALAARDINASYFSQQQSSLFIKATYANNGTSVRCLSDLQPEEQSAPVNLTVYDRPTPPTRLGASMAGNLSLNISWFPPFSLPGVSTSYAIWVDGNATAFVAGLTYYTYRYTGTSPCLNHRITVVARNAAGDSDPSVPLVTDMPQVGQFVATPSSTVVKKDVTHVTIRFIFKVVTCPSFPLQQLYVELTNVGTTNNHLILGPYVPANGSNNVIDASDGLQPDAKYIYTITAVNSVGNSTTSVQTLYTTDVQSSTITGSDHQLNVICFFAEGTLAKGCVVCLEKSGEVVYQMIPRVNGTAKGVIRTELSVDCYNISVMDWEEDGSIGSLGVPASGMTSMSCLGTNDYSSFEELVYIVAGVAIALGIIIIAALLVAMGICCRKRPTKKPGIPREDIQTSHQNGHQTAANTFASDPVYSSSILYMGEMAPVPLNSKLTNKVTAGDPLSQQWAAHLATPISHPTSTRLGSLDYSKLDRQLDQSQSNKRFSSSSVSSYPYHLPPAHTPSHPSPSSPALPMQRRLSGAQAMAVVHEYELPFGCLGVREGRGREGVVRSAAFTDV